MQARPTSKPAWACLLLAWILFAGAAFAQQGRSAGQTVYVPLYSEVPYGDRSGRLLVRASVVVRNLDSDASLSIESVLYRDSQGKRILEFLEAPLRLAPLASHSFDVKETDTSGGTTPSMLVRWKADSPIDPPLVEGLMVSTHQNLGLAFRTVGRVLVPARPSR